jgi:hypothetical protein
MIDKNESIRKAIDALTAWTTEQDSTDFVSRRVGEYLAGPDEGVGLLVGLLNLSGWLLLRLAKAEGESGNATPQEQRAILQDLALKAWRRSAD